jgi:hypothetical protein
MELGTEQEAAFEKLKRNRIKRAGFRSKHMLQYICQTFQLLWVYSMYPKVYVCRDINLPFLYWILKVFRLWRIFLFIFSFYWYIFWGTFEIKLILGPKSSCMCGHANIFHLWVKCQLSWIVQITWIYDIHLCITRNPTGHVSLKNNMCWNILR